MLDSKQTVELFFKSFQKKDFKTMKHSYGKVAVFQDNVFGKLKGDEIGAMWEMLLSSAHDFDLQFKITKSEKNRICAEWEAKYTFTATKNKVHNKVLSVFQLENQKIVSQIDSFNFYRWACQAFGLKGVLLGWTNFFYEKVHAQAKNNLLRFMEKQKQIL